MDWWLLIIVLILGYVAYRLDSMHATLTKFTRHWKLVHRKELAEGEEWELSAIKNDLMTGREPRVVRVTKHLNSPWTLGLLQEMFE